MPSVALALGSNVGDRLATLQGALDDLAAVPGLDLAEVSSVYQTAPVGGPEQDDFLNVVAVGNTTLEPLALLAATQGVEDRWHRTREVHWGPRTLDIDILAIGADRMDLPGLEVPHPRAHERGFVLVPWAEVAPQQQVAGHGRVAALAAAIGSDGVRPTRHRLSVRGED